MDSDDPDGEPEDDRPTVRSIHEAVRPGMGRRAFVGALVAAAVGAGLARWLSVDDVRSADRGEVPIVYGFARSDPDDSRSVEPRKKTVPADWYEELSRTLDVHGALPASELAGFAGSFVVPGERSDPAASIAIQTTAERLRDEVADLSMDAEFDVEVLDDLPEPAGQTSSLDPKVVADLDERSVPGGVFCGSEEMRGSLAPSVYDTSTGGRYFATANHVYGGSGADHRGDPLYVFGGSDRAAVARVRRGFDDQDLLLADPADGHVPASEISGATPGAVGGQFTRLGLADLQARGEPLEMTGAVSGRTSGEINGIDGVTFYNEEGVRTGQLVWGDETTFTDGDSGSVNYHVDPDDDRVLVGGMNNARTWWPGTDFTWGTAGYAIREANGLLF